MLASSNADIEDPTSRDFWDCWDSRNCDIGDDEECEKRLEREEKMCDLIAATRYYGNPAQAATVCKRAAFERYLKCLQGAPESEWPPLTGVETPM